MRQAKLALVLLAVLGLLGAPGTFAEEGYDAEGGINWFGGDDGENRGAFEYDDDGWMAGDDEQDWYSNDEGDGVLDENYYYGDDAADEYESDYEYDYQTDDGWFDGWFE